MTRWEYHWVRVQVYGVNGDPGHYDLETLDSFGSEGWEAYAISEYGQCMVVHLKRSMVAEP